MRRRQVLGAVAGAGSLTVGGTFPMAVGDGALNAKVSVVGAAISDRVEALTVRVINRTDRVIEPVAFVFATGRGPAAWDFDAGQPSIPPGQPGTMTISPPREAEALSLPPGTRAVVRIYDDGTDERTETAVVPGEVPEVVI